MKKKLLGMLTMALTLGALVLAPKSYADTLLGDYLKDKGVEVSVSGGVDLYSEYVWRGFLLDDDVVVQPYVTVSSGIFEGGFWGSWDTENDDALKSDEVDGWVGINFDLGFIDEDWKMVSIKAGHTWYAFPEGNTGLSDGSHAEETYLGFSVDTFLSPYFIWYSDYSDQESGGADGNYLALGGSHGFTLHEDLGIVLTLSQEVGFNNEAFIAGEGGYSLTKLALALPLSENVTLTPTLGYSVPFGDLEDSSDGNQDDQFYAGTSLGFSF